MRHEGLRQEVADVGRKIDDLGLVEFTSGNVSTRDADTGEIVISPTSIEYDRIHAADVLVIDAQGEILEGVHGTSAETPMHCGIYARRPEIGAIVHTHSRWATTFAVLDRQIPAVHYVISSIGDSIRVAPYATFGSEELADGVARELGEDNAILLKNHGVIAVGSDLRSALKNAIRVEFLAEVYWKSSVLGEPSILTPQDIADTREQSATKKLQSGVTY